MPTFPRIPTCGTQPPSPYFTDHSITQAAALVKAKHHIQKFRIKRKSPPAASNIVLLRKIPKGQDQKLKQNLAKNNRENNRREQNKKKARAK